MNALQMLNNEIYLIEAFEADRMPDNVIFDDIL